MAEYAFKALDARGNEKEGSVSADSYQEAIARVKEQGLYPTDVFQRSQGDYEDKGLLQKRTFLQRLLPPKVKMKHLVPFVSDLAVLVDAGVPLIRALDVLSHQGMARDVRAVIAEVRSDVEGGQSLSAALSKQPQCFPPLFVNMVRSGEVSGMLGHALSRLAILYEKTARLERKIKAALMYPFFVLLFALSVVVFIVAFVVPKFFVIFGELGSELPLPTQLLHGFSLFLQHYWIGILFLGVFAGFGMKFLQTVPKVKYALDGMKLRLPVFGALFLKVGISRFCRTFGTLLGSSVPILQTLSVAKDAAENLVLVQAIERVKNSIKEGESVATPLSSSGLFPPLVTNMIMVGEETGALDGMLIKVADRYEEEVDVLVSQLTSLIEPFLIIGLGVIVGFIVVALFLPLVSLVQGLTG